MQYDRPQILHKSYYGLHLAPLVQQGYALLEGLAGSVALHDTIYPRCIDYLACST